MRSFPQDLLKQDQRLLLVDVLSIPYAGNITSPAEWACVAMCVTDIHYGCLRVAVGHCAMGYAADYGSRVASRALKP